MTILQIITFAAIAVSFYLGYKVGQTDGYTAGASDWHKSVNR